MITFDFDSMLLKLARLAFITFQMLFTAFTTDLYSHLNKDLPYILVRYRNGYPNQAKCLSYLGPGGQATRHLGPFTVFGYYYSLP